MCKNKEKIKSEIKNRWDDIDKKIVILKKIQCTICKNVQIYGKIKKYISNCRFYGGKLERYRCDNCGVIFGPLKMLNLTKSEIAFDYNQHYKVWSEGDTSNDEIKTFYSLSPTKNKIYLNFGSGPMSKTVNILRKNGWNVFGYDPYSGVKSENIFSSIDSLKNIKFDGIFSNNVIEHFIDPVKSFKLMINILNNKSIMAHSTPCYKYDYHNTRFHIHFFTGNCVKYISKKLNFDYKLFENKGKYINYIFNI